MLDVFDGNSEGGVCKLVEKGLAVAVGDALESIRTTAFGSRADAVLYGRKSFLMVVVIVAISIFSDAVVP